MEEEAMEPSVSTPDSHLIGFFKHITIKLITIVINCATKIRVCT